MDASKTTEGGLEAATKIREEQRRVKKAKDFQARALDLMDRILNNPELDDVIGGIEGKRGGTGDDSLIPVFLSDDEANAIADIEEAQNILTSDNLDLMSGVLSETDIKILKSLAGGALNRTRGFDRFTGDLTELKNKLSSTMVTTVDDNASSDIEAKKARLAELRSRTQK
jgi:hypothetical protein